ncbi:MAG: RNB domain-containing ribonuclease, partial [Dongiaceae bacterium]
INELVLRSQSQAVYSPENVGHFGLALRRYCHFTSPIRRYADLLVHRALIAAHGFGEDGLTPEDGTRFVSIGEHISGTERRAAAAERDAIDRYVAAYLAERVGEVFVGGITGVTRFGLFVSLRESGGSGIVPISSLPSDYYDHDERRHCLVGRRWGRVYSLGETVAVRLVEEYMIAANVAAAESLEAKRLPCMYRVHPPPDPVKVEALREFAGSLGLSLARGQVIRPAVFARLLEQARDTPYAAMINELVLRSQSQAVYSPENVGHFGLALRRYCHFTSPIRRYADLLVHRALIAAHGFGEDGLTPENGTRFVSIGEHISGTERRAAAAERDAVDRYVAAFLAERVGEVFVGGITGVTRFGLFVMLRESGGSGIVPISSLPSDYYDHDEHRHSLVGRRWGRVYRLGETVAVRLVE